MINGACGNLFYELCHVKNLPYNNTVIIITCYTMKQLEELYYYGIGSTKKKYSKNNIKIIQKRRLHLNTRRYPVSILKVRGFKIPH